MSKSHIPFKYDQVSVLFEDNHNINSEALNTVLELGEAVIPDLLLILDDALKDSSLYTDRLQSKEGGYAPNHALYILRELNEETCFDRLIKFLNLEISTFEKLLGADFLLDEFWSFVCLYGHKHLEGLEKLLFDADIDIKLGIALGLSQMAIHYPEKADDVSVVFRKVTEYYLDSEQLQKVKDKEAVFENSDFDTDIEFISEFARILLEANFTNFKFDIEELFENDVIDIEILEPELVIFNEYLISPNNIFESYEAMSSDLDVDDILIVDKPEDEKPKVKKMKR